MAVQREVVVQTAEKYVSRGKIEPAIREYRKLLAENPNDINTLNRVGDLYARIHRIDEAVDFFTQIAEQYTAEGFFVKAIAIYKKIIKLNPTRLEVYEKLAELYHKQGLINEARTQYQVLADYYHKHENAASAIAIYQKMAELEPDNPSYHVKLAEIYHQQQLIEKALGEYRIIAELMISHGHFQEAAQVYQRGLDIDSENLPFVTDGVLQLKGAGQIALARQLLASALERNPQADRVAQVAGLEEERAEKRPEPIAAAPAAVAPAPAPSVAPPPVHGMFEEEEPPARALPRWGEPPSFAEPAEEEAPARPAPVAAAPADEIDLDLDEVFVLDMEDDEPSSLVKPPPDMLGGGVRRPAWSQDAGTDAGTVAPAAAATDFEVEVEPEEPVWGTPSWSLDGALAEPQEEEVEIEIEVELEADLDAGEEPAIDLGEINLLDSLPGLAGMEIDLEEPAPGPVPMSEAIEAAEELEASFFESGSDWAIPQAEEEMPPAAAATAGAPLPAPEPEPTIDPDLLERTAAELHPQTVDRDEDLVSEAEVLAKYGLEEKAMERLREALRLQPRHLGAHALMIQLHLDKGRHARVVELANHMAQIAATVRDAEPWNRVRRRLTAAGYRFDGERTVGPPQVRPEQNVDQLLRGILGDAPAKKAPTPPSARPLAAAEAAGVFLEPAPVESLPSFPLSTEELELPNLDLGSEPAAPAPAMSPDLAAAAPSPFAAPPAAPAPTPPAAGGGSFFFDPLEIGEMVENEDEDDDVASRTGRTRFSVGGVPAAPSPPAAAVPPVPQPPQPPPPRPPLDDTGGLSWLDETASRQRPAEASRPPRPTAGDFFDEENDFFDLAGELEQELSQEDVFQADELLMPSEQSLEEIVEGFKKGVAEHLSPTDYETHFNLGIAYREMGLLDEAIGEFQLAAKSPTHLVSCCSMLGICFLDKGLPALAVKWYRRGLEAPGLNEEDTLGLLYDLGCAYLTQGDSETAYRTFVELYGINSNYRDVVARLEELGPR